MNRKMILKVIIKLVCFVGCFYQISDLLWLYFEYPFLTTMSITIEATLRVPQLNLCVRYVDILNYSSLHTSTDFKSQQSSYNANKSFETHKLVTIKDIFENTI